MSRKSWFVLIVTLQLVFLAGMALFHASKIKTATRILLETEPVDPFSVFRGRYILLNYKISRVSPGLLRDGAISDLKDATPLYVALEKKAPYWEPVAVYRTKPRQHPVFLAGKVKYAQEKEIRIQYGIESFFLSESSADEIERRQRAFRPDWRQIGQERAARLEQLGAEDKRIHKAGITQKWFKTLDQEMDGWVKEGILGEASAAKLREKYPPALERIKKAQEFRTEERRSFPLTVEVAVAQDGRGYPTGLFWEGREYR
ncbi:MAG: GDYXXLXY domain-containing protein [Candidatus Omnitrophota bacterium]